LGSYGQVNKGAKMVYSEYIKLRILYLRYKPGYYPAAIVRALNENNKGRRGKVFEAVQKNW